jgi:pimeloyl-ACP methyl ester carboxylesterase
MVERVRPSVWQEARVGAELAHLLAHPIYTGRGVTRGDKRVVLVLPGLFASDLYLEPMHRWLRRIGYTPLRSTLLVNVGCPQELCEQVEAHLGAQMKLHPGRVAIIGHSRGGILAWVMAARLGATATNLILLGSPAPAVVRSMSGMSLMSQTRAGARVAQASARARQILDPDCDVPACGCPFPADLQKRLSPETKVTSIYSVEDPIVPKSACRVQGGSNIEVAGTHSGLPYNVEALRAIAGALAPGN